MKNMRAFALVLMVLVFAATLIGCATETPTKWIPVHSRTETESASGTTEQQVTTTVPTQSETQSTEQPTPVPTDVPTQATTVAATEIPEETTTEPIPVTSAAITTEAAQAAGDRTLPAPAEEATTETTEGEKQVRYIGNTNTKKFHAPNCSSVKDMKKQNKLEFTGTREELIAQGYQPCKRCKP